MSIVAEKLFCPRCGKAGAYDCTGEGDWVCSSWTTDDDCALNSQRPFIDPIRERDLNAQEVARLTLENERLRTLIVQLQRGISYE